MSAAPQVSLEEYLNTDYEPEFEYVGGVLVDRNVGYLGMRGPRRS